MGIVSLPSFGSDPATVTAALLDGKVDPLATEFNGSIDNDNIKASAGIVYSKLNLTGNLLNADVSSSAAIDSSKLDLGTVAQNIVMSGKAIEWAKGSDLASAGTMNFGTATGNYFDITGTTTVEYLGTSQAGSTRLVQFDGALTLTHDATQLILPTGADITTAAGDTALFTSEGSGNWRCTSYRRADGSLLGSVTTAGLPAGTVLQTVGTSDGTAGTHSGDLPDPNSNDNAFTTSMGAQIFGLAVTPNSTSNYLLITINAYGTATSTNQFTIGLFSDQSDYGTTTNAIHVAPAYSAGDGSLHCVSTQFWVQVATVSETTFTVRYGSEGTNAYIHRTTSNETGCYGGQVRSTITIQEIKG